MPGPTSVPSDAQAGWHRGQSANFCAVLVLRPRGTRIRQYGTVELVKCVLTVMKCPHLLSKGLKGHLSRSKSFSQQ